MKKKKEKDERLERLSDKLMKEAYLLVVVALLAAAVVKNYVLGLPLSYYVTDLVIALVSVLYIAVRSMFCGNALTDTSKQGRRVTVLAALALSLVVTVLVGARNYMTYGSNYRGLLDPYFLAVLALVFLSCLALVSAGLYAIYYCHKKGQARVDKQLEEAEEEVVPAPGTPAQSEPEEPEEHKDETP